MRNLLIVLTLIVVGLVSGCATNLSDRASLQESKQAYEMYHGSGNSE